MNKRFCMGLEDVFNVFEEYLSAADYLETKMEVQISSEIVKERLRLNKTQKEFAEHLGVSQSLVSRWESDSCNFSIKTLAAIAEKLDWEISFKVTHLNATKPEDDFCFMPGYTKSISEVYQTSSYCDASEFSAKKSAIYRDSAVKKIECVAVPFN